MGGQGPPSSPPTGPGCPRCLYTCPEQRVGEGGGTGSPAQRAWPWGPETSDLLGQASEGESPSPPWAVQVLRGDQGLPEGPSTCIQEPPAPPELAGHAGAAGCPVHSPSCSGATRELRGWGSRGPARLPDSNTCWMRMPSTAPQPPGTSPADTATALWTEADMV